MDKDKLIQAVTNEVLKRLMDILKDNNINLVKDKEKVLLLSTLEESSNIQQELNLMNYDFYTQENVEDVDVFDFVVVENLTNSELVNLSLGVPSGKKEKLIIDCILKGKKIALLSEGIEYRRHEDTCNSNFLSMYRGYEKKVSDFGINILSKDKLSTFIKGNVESVKDNSIKEVDVKEEISNEVSTENINLINKKLITETELRRSIINGSKNIKISKKAIVTPLAKDFIRTNRLNIIKG